MNVQKVMNRVSLEVGIDMESRKYKFRGYSNEQGDWVYGAYIRDELTTRTGDHFIYSDKLYRVVGLSVSQSLEITDKNGKEVFELDVVYSAEWNPAVYLIKYLEGIYALAHHQLHDEYRPDIHYVETEFEIIGNVIDNPKLYQQV